MNKFLFVFLAVAMGLAFVLFQTDLIWSQNYEPVATQRQKPEPLGDMKSSEAATVHESTLTHPITKPAQTKHVTVTVGQIQQLEHRQQEISAMMTEYEQVRSDPTQRALHRQAMQKKLEQYSQDVLPIVLAKIQQVE